MLFAIHSPGAPQTSTVNHSAGWSSPLIFGCRAAMVNFVTICPLSNALSSGSRPRFPVIVMFAAMID
jgi:hypothetical protein